MDYEGLIDDNHVLISLIACSINYETAVTSLWYNLDPELADWS